MAEPFLGEIRMFALGFTVRGWAPCDGRLLPIAQNAALFSLLGTTYGGDGRTTFALPDLRGRASLGMGHGPGLSDVRIGQTGGHETVTTDGRLMAQEFKPLPGGIRPFAFCTDKCSIYPQRGHAFHAVYTRKWNHTHMIQQLIIFIGDWFIHPSECVPLCRLEIIHDAYTSII